MNKTFTINCNKPEITLSYKTKAIPNAGESNIYVYASYPSVSGYSLEWTVWQQSGSIDFTRTVLTDECRINMKRAGTCTYGVTCLLQYGGKTINSKTIYILGSFAG